VRTLAEALGDPQTAHNRMLLSFDHPSGEKVQTVGTPVHLGDADTTVRLPPPRLGEHSAEILAELGYSPDDVAALFDGGVVA
jgi:formyl-CoA transferase